VKHSRRWIVLVAVVSALAMVVAACGGSDDKSGSGSSTTAATSGEQSGPGTLVLGAEQEMECADWIASCAGSAWGVYVMEEHTIPRVFDYAKQGDDWVEVPSPLVTTMPTVADVGGKQVVTYTINPAAVWSDGEPITSTDFKYTAEQIRDGDDIYDKTGYTNIESVDDSNPKVAVVTFSESFAGWRQLFSALYGVFPSHLLQGKDRAKAMTNGYDWSGGPWIADWQKGVQVVLTPNPNYWGEKPKVQKVIFKFLADTAAEFQAFKSGEVLAIYPQPQLDAVAQIKKGLPDSNSFVTDDTANVEALWMNNAKFPLDSVAVRQAMAYSIDRDAIVARLFGDIGVTKAVQTLNPPIQSRYADTQAYAGYTLQPGKVESLMTGDGWAKGSDGIWAKNGKKASMTVITTTGNKRRELTEQIVQEQLKAQGFQISIKNQEAGDLFGTTLPAGNYQLGLYAQIATSLDPGLCTIACSQNIPSKANKNSGQNWQRINVPALDPLLQTVDTSIDNAVRIDSSKKADQVMAQEQVTLPLDPLPNIVLWSKRIQGAVGDNPILGPFWNMNTWTVTG
jgi:peptide/nickel transport system substrate-binding protein